MGKMTELYLLIILILTLNEGVNPMTSSKTLEGYPTGFLANCPGSRKPAIITSEGLKHIGITVVARGGKKTKYNYRQAKLIAKDPSINFKKRDTILLIGGYGDPMFYTTLMGNAYNKLGYNVLAMHCYHFLSMHYPESSRYMRPVGMHMAEMLTNLTEVGLDIKRLHLLGISLGGQTVSYIAKNFYRMTGQKLPRITALDPAGPCFRNLGPEDRLDQSDADFLDVVDTNIDGFGMAAPVGHVNFYVNGGEYQPGNKYLMTCLVVCSHLRSAFLWLAALNNPDKFIAIKCDSVQQARNLSCYDNQPMVTNVLGNKVDKTKQGIFFLATGSEFPYYLGEDGMKRENEFWTKTF